MSTGHLAACLGVLAVLGAFSWYVLRRHQRQEHARRTMAARQAVPGARGIDGSHEACEVPEWEELVWERYASRYRCLGQDVTSNREGL